MTDEQQKGLNDTPVQDISDSKDEAEKTFLKELDDAEKTPEVATAPAGKNDKGGDKSKSKFAAAMDAASKPKRKSSMDPILAVSLVVLILASCVVLGNAAYGEFIEKGQTTTVAYGDTVAVQYTGSYYSQFDDTHSAKTAIVFDTNVEAVGKYVDEHPEERSWSYTMKTSYSDLSFTVGGDSVLKKFGSATINHKVGDVIKVNINREDGYELPETSKGMLTGLVVTVGKEIDMTTSEFSSLYGFSAPTTGILYVKCDDAMKQYCPFGCDYSVCTVDGKVHVVNDYKTGEVKAFGGYLNDGATLVITDKGDGKYTIDYSKVSAVEKEGNRCTKVPVIHNNSWVSGYVYSEKVDEKVVTMYKIGETLGADLCFVIKITKITKA